MFNVICDSVISGTVNLIDTADNFRYCKSERTVGAALSYLINKKHFQRNELIISSKGGFIAEDADLGLNRRDIIEQLIKENVIDSETQIREGHCLEAKYIEKQFESSRRRIGVSTLDFYSINLPELHLPYMSRQEFFDKLLVS